MASWTFNSPNLYMLKNVHTESLNIFFSFSNSKP